MDVSLIEAIAFPALVLFALTPAVAFIVPRVHRISSAGHLVMRDSKSIQKRHRVMGLVAAGVVAAFALTFGVSHTASWASGDRESTGEAELSYLVFQGTVESTKVGKTTFFNDTPSELWLRAEGHPELILKVGSQADVAMLYDRDDVPSVRLYCLTPTGEEKSLTCSSDKSRILNGLDPTRTFPEKATVEHAKSSEEWPAN